LTCGVAAIHSSGKRVKNCMARGAAILLGTAWAGMILAGCLPQSRSGGGLPAGYVEYVARPGDTPWSVAERLYGRGYLEYRIREANAGALTPGGFYEAGTRLVIPPGLNGRPVEVDKVVNGQY